MPEIKLTIRNFLLSGLVLATLFTEALGYTPAVAANSSDSLNVSDNSTVSITWNPNGGYSTALSYQRAGENSVGISKVWYST
jgi:hypothetical protein